MSDVKVITALKPQKQGKRVNLFLDNEFALGLSREVVAEAGIQLGQKLSQAEVEELKQAELLHRALAQALNFLSYRPRSKAEIKTKLSRLGYEEEIIQKTINRLQEMGLADDAAFAKFWKENRESFSPRSKRLLARELRGKGIDPELIGEVINEVDNELEAYRAGQKKARSLSQLNYFDFRKKLSAFLYRRGFNYEVIKPVVERLWQERA